MYCTVCTVMYVCLKNRATFFSFCPKRFSKRGKVEHFLSTTALLPQQGISEGKKYVMDIHILEGKNPRRLNKGRILQVLKRRVYINCTVKKKVSAIPDGDWNAANLFYSVQMLLPRQRFFVVPYRTVHFLSSTCTAYTVWKPSCGD
jgi:hypothetical protein